jgi:hypothetical protein
MRNRSLMWVVALAAAAGVVVVHASVLTAGQTAGAAGTAKPKNATVPRTSDGRPDLQGVWNFATATPLERPNELAGKAFLSSEEVAAFETKTVNSRSTDRRDGGAQADIGRAYNDFWVDWGTRVVATKRTSLVIDPPDGKIPPLTSQAAARSAARVEANRRPVEGPEQLNLSTRCILGFNAGPPMVTGPYNNNVQLFQTSDVFVILNEMNHNARVVPLNGRPHIPPAIRLWSGDSRGRWEGNTLVVDSTNFGPMGEINFRGFNSEKMQLTERFTRVDEDTLLYEFTVTDPMTWTTPWTVSLPMTKSQDLIYEYACHEGNYGMFGILSGSRADEKRVDEEARKK